MRGSGTGGGYPIPGGHKLTIWQELDGNTSANYANLGVTPFAKGLAGRTGIAIEYLHPAGNATEQFNLIIASGDFPDIYGAELARLFGRPGKSHRRRRHNIA